MTPTSKDDPSTDPATDGDAAQYFAAKPSVASNRSTVALSLPDMQLELKTDRGVFAGTAETIDAGTRLLLLEAIEPLSTGAIVDVGCGYGAIALTVASRSPEASVWAVDVNERARALCAENAHDAGLTNVQVISPSDIPADLAVDAIYSNPPIRIGKRALRELVAEWLGRLSSGGAAHFVVHKHLGSDSFATWLVEEGWQVERVRSRKGYRVLSVRAGTSEGRNIVKAGTP